MDAKSMVRGGFGIATAGVIAAVAFKVFVGVVLIVVGLGIVVFANRLLPVSRVRERRAPPRTE